MILDADQSNLKLSASKRAKTDNYMAYESGEGILSKLFESPFGMIRRMWSGLGTGPADGADKSPKDQASQLRTGKTFRSAETMATSTDAKKNSTEQNKLYMPVSTKQFSADFSESSSKGKRRSSGRQSPPVRQIWPSSTFTLECQPSGNPVDFDLYDEVDLPFLDKSTEVGRMVSKNIIN